MFTECSNMIKGTFRAGTKLASALEKGASAIDHLAGWADQTAGAFADTAAGDRAIALAARKAQLKAV